MGIYFAYGVGDFNADGKLDFSYSGLVTQFQDKTQQFSFVTIDSNGIVQKMPSVFATIPVATHAREMYVADFNNDGVDDFFSANHRYDAPLFRVKRIR